MGAEIRLHEIGITRAELRDLARSGIAPATAPIVVEVEVMPGAPFAGKTLRELGLPRGCVVVTVRDGGRETIPQADTRLAPHARLTAVIAPEAEGAYEMLRAGVTAAHVVDASE